MRRLSAACSIAALCLFVPSLSFAQVALTGVVKDPSGCRPSRRDRRGLESESH